MRAWKSVVLFVVGVASGCGLVLDTDPPGQSDETPDGGPGPMDAGGDDDAKSCESDSDCEDGLYCTGQSYCFRGTCTTPVAPSCPDDGVDCTVEACDEDLDGCTSIPNDTACSPTACGTVVCDRTLGCVPGPADPAECMDAHDCTIDNCALGTCEHVALADRCAAGHYCDVAAGCVPLPSCASASDCGTPPPCTVFECMDGRCASVPVSFDPRCTSADPCVGARCTAAGACELLPPIPCAGDGCRTATCGRNADGTARCDRAPRPDGDPCGVVPGACETSRCVAGTCADAPVCASSDPCVYVGCGTTGSCEITGYFDCGPYGLCDGSSGTPTCTCADGWTDCPAGRCACPATACTAMTADCDGDTICECDLSTSFCSIIGAGLPTCVPLRDCPVCATSDDCCLYDGMCHPRACPSCCRPIAS